MIRMSSLIGGLLVALCLPAWSHSPEPPAASSVSITRDVHTPLDGHFALISQNGGAVSDRDFRGTPMLIYFGYTSCPDVCPLNAQTISSVVDLLEARGERVSPIFITVDPERDTPDRLKTFLSAFDPRFVGLTGDVAEIRRVTAAYGAEDDRVNERAPGDYDMLHPALAYLMGRKGQFLNLVRLTDDAETVAATIETQLRADH